MRPWHLGLAQLQSAGKAPHPVLSSKKKKKKKKKKKGKVKRSVEDERKCQAIGGLKECRGKNGENRSSDRPKLGSSSRGDPKAWYYYWCFGVLTQRGLSWLLSEKPNKQLKESDADIYTQWIEAADPCGWIREKLEEAEEEGDPIGRPAVSINLDLWDLSDTGPPNRQHTPADMRPPTHIQQRTARSGLSQRRCT
jgi:hypothetical protein